MSRALNLRHGDSFFFVLLFLCYSKKNLTKQLLAEYATSTVPLIQLGSLCQGSKNVQSISYILCRQYTDDFKSL